MKEVFLSIATVIAISLPAAATVFASAMGSGHRVDMILAQAMEQEINQEMQQEVPSEEGTPQEEMGSGQGTAQGTGSPQGICVGPGDCPEQNEATAPDNN